jgi:hypothetical protein
MLAKAKVENHPFPANDLGPVDLSALHRFARFLQWFRQESARPSQTALIQAMPAQDPYA